MKYWSRSWPFLGLTPLTPPSFWGADVLLHPLLIWSFTPTPSIGWKIQKNKLTTLGRFKFVLPHFAASCSDHAVTDKTEFGTIVSLAERGCHFSNLPARKGCLSCSAALRCCCAAPSCHLWSSDVGPFTPYGLFDGSLQAEFSASACNISD